MEIDRERLSDGYRRMPTEELLDLHARGTLTEAAYEVLEGLLGERGTEVPPRPELPEVKPERASVIEFMDQHWRGERSLGSAYWLIGIIGSFAVVLLWGLMRIVGLAAVTSAFSAQPDLRVYYLWGLFGSPVTVYFMFAWVAIWRCAWNSPWPAFGYIARFIVIISVLRYVSLLAIQLRVL